MMKSLSLISACILWNNTPLLTSSRIAFLPVAEAFSHPTTFTRKQTCSPSIIRSASTDADSTSTRKKNLVVISPPGGLGEVTAVEAAKKGASVQWFVISAPPSPSPPSSKTIPQKSFTLSSSALATIRDNGGNVEVAGADADTLLLPSTEPTSALPAVSAWCRMLNSGGGISSSAIVCVVDGIEEAIENGNFENPKEVDDATNIMMDAIKVAAREACSSVSFSKGVAVIPSNLEEGGDDGNNKNENDSKDEQNFLTSIFGKGKVEVPASLSTAMNEKVPNFANLRYGELFGLPESGEIFPFVGGPRRDPILRDEYRMRSIRIDPTISLSGYSMVGSSTRSSRLSVGAAATQMALNLIPLRMNNLDICLTSLSGIDVPSSEEWNNEFDRVQKLLTSGKGAQLFSVSFGTVPSIERMSDWIASKWAPAVMKTYDIAGIRVGPRPVFANRKGEGIVEIVWQELIDFQTDVVGSMKIEVTANGMIATRGPGDASIGYGSVSPKPLPGEDILVRRLSDAATQAIERGLASKPKPKKREKKVEAVKKTKPVVSTIVSSGEVPQAVPESISKQPSTDRGPRTAGTRRSSTRKRGARRRTRTEGSPSTKSETPTKNEASKEEGTWE